MTYDKHFGTLVAPALLLCPRDVLLESAIGLDSLLVPGGGEARYKFCLHGAAILSPSMGTYEEVYRQLDEVYTKRSQAAHGRRAKEVESLSIIARTMLANAIHLIARLTLDGELDVAKDTIASAVQWYVIRKATR